MSNNGLIILGALGLLYLVHKQNAAPSVSANTPSSSSTSANTPIAHLPVVGLGGGGGGGIATQPVDTAPLVYGGAFYDPFDAPFFTQAGQPESYREEYPVAPGVIDASGLEQ